jgi:hypothetical protein
MPARPFQAGNLNEVAQMKVTSEIASDLGIQPESMHARICRTGSYFGIRPQKLPNGRLLWPDDTLDLLLGRRSKPAKEADHATS